MIREEFDALFYEIQQHYGTKLPRDVVEKYWDHLKPRTALSLERSFKNLSINHPKSNGFPTIEQFSPPPLFVPQGAPPKTYLDRLEQAHQKAMNEIRSIGLNV